MAMIVVGGSGRGVGKTTLICGLIAALPEFGWTAVKITGHAHQPSDVWEETAAGQGTDTARFLLAGAKRALLVSAAHEDLPMGEIRSALGTDRYVIFESNRVADCLQPDLCLAVVGRQEDVKNSFRSFAGRADAVVARPDMEWNEVTFARAFRMNDFGKIPAEMVVWLRARLVRDG